MDRRDLALEAAFTSMSLRERCREPGVECTRVLTSLPSTAQTPGVNSQSKGFGNY